MKRSRRPGIGSMTELTDVSRAFGYQKAGFAEEGRHRESVWHDGRWYDEVLISILDHEWAPAGRLAGERADAAGRHRDNRSSLAR
jgi:hypothetical protein